MFININDVSVIEKGDNVLTAKKLKSWVDIFSSFKINLLALRNKFLIRKATWIFFFVQEI